MAVLVIGGSGSGAGKTAVGCALIAAMPEFCWLAVKVTPHLHDGGEIFEETGSGDAGAGKDTARYLRAGARRAFLVRAVEGDPAELVREVRRRALECDGLLVESNRVLPELVAGAGEKWISLAVLDDGLGTGKASLTGAVERADGLVLTGGALPERLSLVAGTKPVFSLPDGVWESPELVALVRGRLIR